MKNKSLKQNSIFNVLYRMLNVLFPLFTSSYLGHVLLASGVGRVSFAQNIVMYFTTIATLGIPNYGIREIAKRQNDKDLINKLFTELFTINCISTTICFFSYYAMVFVHPYFRDQKLLYCMAGIAIPLTYLNIDWLYQGYEEYQYIAIRSAIVKVICLAIIFACIKTPSDVEAYALIYCCAIGGNNILNIINLKRIGVSFRFAKIQLKEHLAPIFVLFASVIAIELYTMLDTTMIGVMCSDENVGYYTNSMKLVKVLITAITAIAAVLLPRLSYYYSRGMVDKCSEVVSKVFNVLLFLFIPCAAGIFLVAPQVMPIFFGKTFRPAIITLRIASLLICIIGFSNLFGTQVLLTFGQEKKLLICTLSGAGTNILMNSLLIPRFAQNGAAVASVFSELLVTIISSCFALRYIKLRVDLRNLACISLATVTMIVAVIIVQNTAFNDWQKMVISTVVGCGVYFFVNLFGHNPLILEAIALVRTQKM